MPILENNIILNDILSRNYYRDFYGVNPKRAIDLIFSNDTCNSCDHCYLSLDKHIDCYKERAKFSLETIQNNLKIFIDWYVGNYFNCNINLKNGDLILTNENICLLDNFLNINSPITLTIYTTLDVECDFQTIKSYINKLNQKNIKVHFKLLLNGFYCDPMGRSELFYQSVLNFLENEHYSIIANITPYNVRYWIENYKWWLNILGEKAFSLIDLNEVSSDQWTDDLIGNYISFLDFQVDILSKVVPSFANFVFVGNEDIHFNSIQLLSQEILSNKKHHRNCDFHNNLTIDIQTFNLLLCSKINYDSFYLGTFNVETKQWEAIVPELSILKAHLKRSSTPHCEKCNFIELCNGFCYGASFEKKYNLLIPIRQYCHLIQAKYQFLIYKYNTMNYFNLHILDNLNITPIFKQYLTHLHHEIMSRFE